MCKNGSIFRVQFIQSSAVLCLCSTAFQLLLIFLLYDLWNDIPSVLGCLIVFCGWNLKAFIILMEVCAGWNLLEPSKMVSYAMYLFFALNISTGEIYAFYAQFYGTRKRRGCFVCVHDLKENKYSSSPDKENYNLKKESFICTSFHYLIIAKTLALCQSEILFFFSLLAAARLTPTELKYTAANSSRATGCPYWDTLFLPPFQEWDSMKVSFIIFVKGSEGLACCRIN